MLCPGVEGRRPAEDVLPHDHLPHKDLSQEHVTDHGLPLPSRVSVGEGGVDGEVRAVAVRDSVDAGQAGVKVVVADVLCCLFGGSVEDVSLQRLLRSDVMLLHEQLGPAEPPQEMLMLV